jgi:hypothetical protein
MLHVCYQNEPSTLWAGWLPMQQVNKEHADSRVVGWLFLFHVLTLHVVVSLPYTDCASVSVSQVY